MVISDEIKRWWDNGTSSITPYICTGCGKELTEGVVANAIHSMSCKNDAPNCNIYEHHEKIIFDGIRAAREKRSNQLWQFMNEEEQRQYMKYQYAGFLEIETNTVYMGMDQFKRFDQFEEEMFKKYDV